MEPIQASLDRGSYPYPYPGAGVQASRSRRSAADLRAAAGEGGAGAAGISEGRWGRLLTGPRRGHCAMDHTRASRRRWYRGTGIGIRVRIRSGLLRCAIVVAKHSENAAAPMCEVFARGMNLLPDSCAIHTF